MEVLIAKQNKDIIRGYISSIRFIDKTAHTCTFRIDEATFEALYKYIKEQGYNPFAVMSW